MNKIKKLSWLIALVFAISGCKKETGPQGPPGPMGNANVQSFTLTTSWWNYTGNILSQWWSIPEITQDIYDNGMVMAYRDVGYWEALPTSYTGSGGSTVTWAHYHDIGVFEIDISHNVSGAPADPGTEYFKLVIASSRFMAENPDLDWHNYNEVNQRLKSLGIKEQLIKPIK